MSFPAQDDVIERVLRHLNLWDPAWRRQRRAQGSPRAPSQRTQAFSGEPHDAFDLSDPQINTEEEKCAFFDMTGPWWTYIQDSGKTYGWFMGDRVHANRRGCQIIDRLLLIWFMQ